MIIKGLLDEDFVNYRVPSMTIMFPYCSMKCDKECGKPICQNSSLNQAEDYDVSVKDIVTRYITNSITDAMVFQGLEPLDSFGDVLLIVSMLRSINCYDDIVIYTGYNKKEIKDKIISLKQYGIKNIVIKYGRFIPGQEPHHDEVLGVNLASNNQYAERIC